MKIRITKRVKDLDTGITHIPGDILEKKDRKRGEKFLPYGVEIKEAKDIEVKAEEVKPKKRKKKV